jgi:peptidoglycan hydrolase-like protein with peptidoglycan-binding domain
MASGGEEMACFAYLSTVAHIGWTPPDLLIIGVVGALGALEAVRECASRLRSRWRPEIQMPYGARAQSAPTLASMQRSREAEKAYAWLAVDGQFGPESVRALQVLLTRNGMNAGKIDGVFGTKTKRAFQEFLRWRGYDVGKIDGFMGPRSVKALQVWLKDFGFSPTGPKGNPTDGIWGPFTTRSLQQTLNKELGASYPKRSLPTITAAAAAADPIVKSASSGALSRVNSRGTLSSLGFLQDECEREKGTPRRTVHFTRPSSPIQKTRELAQSYYARRGSVPERRFQQAAIGTAAAWQRGRTATAA